MTQGSTERPSRPQYRNIHVTQILSYRLPPAGVVSILHRISGALMFLLLPVVVWLFDLSLSSDVSYSQFTSVFVGGCGVVPGIVFKLLALALLWAYLHHFVAGMRHLIMDATHSVSKSFGHNSAVFTLAVSVVLTAALGYRLFL
jgi:succinate dehydrogenase / fumarate reductase cytochrome b subunit